MTLGECLPNKLTVDSREVLKTWSRKTSKEASEPEQIGPIRAAHIQLRLWTSEHHLLSAATERFQLLLSNQQFGRSEIFNENSSFSRMIRICLAALKRRSGESYLKFRFWSSDSELIEWIECPKMWEHSKHSLQTNQTTRLKRPMRTQRLIIEIWLNNCD